MLPPLIGGYESERDAPNTGPSPIINIKKEKRETEEETKEILRKLERDNVSLSDQQKLPLNSTLLSFSSPCSLLTTPS